MIKRFLLTILISLFMVSACYATIIEIGGGKVDSSGYSYTPVSHAYEVVPTHDGVNTITGQVVWTPASGKSIVLMGVMFSAEDKTAFTVEADVVEDSVTSGVFEATTVIPDSYCTASGIVVIGNGTPIWKGSADSALYFGAVEGGYEVETNAFSILLWGYEE